MSSPSAAGGDASPAGERKRNQWRSVMAGHAALPSAPAGTAKGAESGNLSGYGSSTRAAYTAGRPVRCRVLRRAHSEVLVGLHRCTEQDSASCRVGNSDPTQRAFQGAARVCSHACLDSQQAAQLHPEHAADSGQDSAGWSLDPCHVSHAMGLRPNPSIERTTSGALRAPTVAAYVER